MRQKRDPQRNLQDLKPNWSRARQLAEIDRILDAHPELCDLVADDLAPYRAPQKLPSRAGAKGMTAEQVLRVAILKQLKQWAYRTLWDVIDDSERLRSFCRFGDRKIPMFNTLAENVKRIRVETWKAVNAVLLQEAKDHKIEKGRQIRIDTTGVESMIHHPTDSRLIWDCVRVATRLMVGCREAFPHVAWSFGNHTRRAKRREFKIANTSKASVRTAAYRDLLKVGQQVLEDGRQVRAQLDALTGLAWEEQTLAEALRGELDAVLALFPRILEQCRRRVIDGESVPAEEKVVSIFEPHTDILVKGQREPQFGHKICLTGGTSNLILDCILERGNPADSSLFVPALTNTRDVLGHVPERVATDGGFYSQANADEAEALGVQAMDFGGKRKNTLTHHVVSARIHRLLRRFRAGIEGVISATKRAYGLDRCTWRGWDGFQRYVWSAIVAWNLQVLARHLVG